MGTSISVEYDPFAPEFRADPYPAYKHLRRSAPVHWAAQSKMWVVSRYADVLAVLKDTAQFSSDAMASVLTGSTRRASGMPGIPRPSVVTSDPPIHAELRNMVNRGFTPKQVSAWKPAVEMTVGECVDSMRTERCFDLVQQLAVPVPVIVIATVLGVEPGRYADFKRWATVITQGMNGSKRQLGYQGSGAAAASREMSEYLGGVIQRRRGGPGTDVLSVLMRASEGDALTAQEAIDFANLLLFAGSETTANLIGNAINALLTHRDALAQVRADPSLIGAVIEETLRWDPPVHYIFRRAIEDVEIARTGIARNSIIALLIASANRDEAAFGADASKFDIARVPESPHVGFGFGAHFCLGAALARMETTVSLERVVPLLLRARRIDAPREYIDSLQFHGLASIPMEWN